MANLLGKFLNIELERQGITQTTFAHRIGSTQPIVSNWILATKTLPPIDKLPSIAKTLGVDEAVLLQLYDEARHELAEEHSELMTAKSIADCFSRRTVITLDELQAVLPFVEATGGTIHLGRLFGHIVEQRRGKKNG